MKVLAAAVCGCVLGAAATGYAQSLDDLNIQIHGYVTQGFLYTTNNNIFTTNSSNGSAALMEAVVNISAQPIPKLRIAVQGRYFLLGNYGDAITLDWAMGDYKVDDRFGVRFGQVKTPWGLFNETQDIDPSYIWSLLPQSIYPILSRDSFLSHYGGVVYGTFKLSPKLGKIEYRGWGGEGLYGSDDGLFLNQVESGINLPDDGIKGPLWGVAIHWRTPLPGLMIGASDLKDNQWNATATQGALTGTMTLSANSQPNYFALYEKNKIMVAFEYERNWNNELLQFPGLANSVQRGDDRDWYAMASYKLTDKLTAGLYDSQDTDHQAPLGPPRYQKDWVISGRYDFNQYLYAKAEQHFIDGTTSGYDMDLNPNGLKLNTKLTVLKVGVSF
jgi:hypothetical protein